MHGSAKSPTAVHILGESTDVMSMESQEHLDFRVGVRFHGTRHTEPQTKGRTREVFTCSIPFPGAQSILSLRGWESSGRYGRPSLAEKDGDACLRHGDQLGFVGAM
jgi:hypothetical protein